MGSHILLRAIMQVPTLIACLVLLVSSIKAASIEDGSPVPSVTASIEEPTAKDDEWKEFERYFGNVALSKECCSTILDLIGKIHHIPAWIKAPAKAACQFVPGSGHQVSGAICTALKPFHLKGPCEKVCDKAMNTAHCKDGVSKNEGLMNEENQEMLSISQSPFVSTEAKSASKYSVQSATGFFRFNWDVIMH